MTMRVVVEPLRERLPRVDAQCMRLMSVWNRKVVPHGLLPLSSAATRLALGPMTDSGTAEPCLCVDFVDDQQDVHWQIVLAPRDLERLNALVDMARVAPDDVLLDCLGAELRLALQASVALMQRKLTQRLRWTDSLPSALCRVIAGPVGRVGELKLGVSREWIDALDADASARGVALGPRARSLALSWGLLVPMPALERRDISSLAPGDCLRVTAPSFVAGRWATRLVPLGAGVARDRWHPGPCVRFVRDAQALYDLSVVKPEEMDVFMDEPLGIDDLRVPVVMALPSLTLSLCEIDELVPGRLLATGISVDRIAVELLSAGHCFARGRLVSVGDSLAVEVLDVVAAE